MAGMGREPAGCGSTASGSSLAAPAPERVVEPAQLRLEGREKSALSSPASFLAETAQIAQVFRTEGAGAVADRLGLGPSRIQLLRKSPERWQEFRDQLAEHSPEGSAHTVLRIQGSRPSLYDLTDDLTDDLAGITAPTLVVNGDEDEACLDVGLLLKRAIPTAGLRVEPNTGHALNLEEPERYNALLREFVATVEAGAWPVRDPRTRAAGMGMSVGTGVGTATAPRGCPHPSAPGPPGLIDRASASAASPGRPRHPPRGRRSR